MTKLGHLSGDFRKSYEGSASLQSKYKRIAGSCCMGTKQGLIDLVPLFEDENGFTCYVISNEQAIEELISKMVQENRKTIG